MVAKFVQIFHSNKKVNVVIGHLARESAVMCNNSARCTKIKNRFAVASIS